MTAPLSLRQEARAEIQEAYQWYERQRSGLGREFLQAVRETLAAVEGAPLRYPVVRGDVRRALLRRFPYSVLYIAEPGSTIVLACFQAESPTLAQASLNPSPVRHRSPSTVRNGRLP